MCGALSNSGSFLTRHIPDIVRIMFRTKPCLQTWTAVVFLVILSAGCRLSKNFHEIDPGKYYRSAQLTGDEFRMAIEKFGIRTIINLRGAFGEEDWYKDEVAISQKYDVTLIDIGMSAFRIPHRQDLITLLDAFRDAERPMLIHCKAGADRTGEASAIYQMEYMGKTKKQALRMLKPKYLHFPILLPSKTYFIRIYDGLDWAYNTYDPCAHMYHYYDRIKYCSDGRFNENMIDSILTVEEDT